MELKNAHNSVTVQNRTHVYMNFFVHKDLGNHLLQLCPKVMKHPVYIYICVCVCVCVCVRAHACARARVYTAIHPSNFVHFHIID